MVDSSLGVFLYDECIEGGNNYETINRSYSINQNL